MPRKNYKRYRDMERKKGYPDEDEPLWSNRFHYRKYPFLLGICQRSGFDSVKEGLDYVVNERKDPWWMIEQKFGFGQFAIRGWLTLLDVPHKKWHGFDPSGRRMYVVKKGDKYFKRWTRRTKKW